VRSNFFAAMPAYQGSHRRPFLRPRNSHILVVSIYLRKWYRFGSGRKKATNKGLLLPRIDFADRPDPASAGLMVFVNANGPQGNNAVYVYNGTQWVKLTTSTISMGDYAFGGIVFYIDATGQHGYVASSADQGVFPWGCNGTLIGPGAEYLDFGTGQDNTTAIVNACSETDIAAKVCDDLILNSFSDWFLPSNDEVDSIYIHRDLLNGINTGWYWSSTEWDAGGATFHPFDQPLGSIWITTKSNPAYVRCVRKF
ncbi:MAG: hypothetical protein NTX61_06110, partial [Bacteroidetes bacterium]|nr:hypothetical protein [Bacteroidota bacterium]